VRIKVHPALCVGSGACRQFASSVYHLDDEGYLELRLVQVPPELERDARFGASACPARAVASLPFVRFQLRRVKHQPYRRWAQDLAQAATLGLAAVGLSVGWLPLGAVGAAVQVVLARIRPPPGRDRRNAAARARPGRSRHRWACPRSNLRRTMPVTIDPSITLAELVTQRPALARELERRSLDYCCGGQRTLADACAGEGLDVDETATALAAAPGGGTAPWATFGPVELVDHLEATHHAYLHGEFGRLTALADKVAQVHGGRHRELLEVQRLYAELRADLEPHLGREEQVLFPMIRELAAAATVPPFHCGTLANPISVMVRDHDRAGELLEQLRVVTHGYVIPDDACASYTALYAGLHELEADTHLHVHKENNLLFPAVITLEVEMPA
jgi:regulator of cell morphogenesis and NO signaling